LALLLVFCDPCAKMFSVLCLTTSVTYSLSPKKGFESELFGTDCLQMHVNRMVSISSKMTTLEIDGFIDLAPNSPTSALKSFVKVSGSYLTDITKSTQNGSKIKIELE
jgi:hypothetical protein